MFSVDDKVFYPMHGAGIIKKIEQREVFGTQKNYYILQFPLSHMTVLLPTDNAANVGLRKISDPVSVTKVLDFLKDPEQNVNENWNQRFRENSQALKNGDILALAKVVKSLMLRLKEKGLSTNEKKMLEEARLCLSSEIALAQDVNPEEAEQVIEDAVNQ